MNFKKNTDTLAPEHKSPLLSYVILESLTATHKIAFFRV